jgi:hypothetical protein
MKFHFRVAAGETKTALVIVFPPEFKGLFNPRIYELVREVQEQLHGVYVTFALSSGSCPDLRASIAAARFVGCESAVVVLAAANDIARFIEHGSNGDWLVTASTVHSELDAPALVDAYLVAAAEVGRAA